MFWKKKKEQEEIVDNSYEELLKQVENLEADDQEEIPTQQLDGSEDPVLEGPMESAQDADPMATKLHQGLADELPKDIEEPESPLQPQEDPIPSEFIQEPILADEGVDFEEGEIAYPIDGVTEYIDGDQVARELEEISTQNTGQVTASTAMKSSTRSGPGIFGRLFGCLGNLIFLAFVLVMTTVVIINAISFVRNEEPSFMGYKMYIIGEDSMSPTIQRNDAIIVKAIPPEQLQVGDLITYESKSSNAVITGWITRILDNERYEIKKKMNNEQAVIIDAVAVTGIATYRVANMGDFVEFISHPFGIGLVILVGIFIYLIMWLVNRRRDAMA
ncbi:MAG: hypothetical protein Q4G61_03780 [Tissierellia bacterium]|nr:hypothetical protein [Tissierellia bacterium]